MRINLITIGSKMPAWVDEGSNEYFKRLKGNLDIKLFDLPLGKRGKSIDINKTIAAEGDAMLNTIQDRDHVIALDVKGKPWSTEQLAENMHHWQMTGDNVSLLVGGPDGLDPRCLDRANQRWSLSNLTLPHPLVKVILAEQLYRGWSILHNHPYHRA